jgi:hypothetical protein
VRLYSLLLRLGTAVLLMWLVWRLMVPPLASPTERQLAAVLAVWLHLSIPLGFWWTLGFQTHPLLMAIFLSAFLLLTFEGRAATTAAGVMLGLALLTSMTALPYLAFIMLWHLLRRPTRLLLILPPMVATYAAVAWWFHVQSEGAFLTNVVFNQVGSFPREELTGEPLWQYALRKITREGTKILGLEAAYLVVGFAGIGAWSARAWKAHATGAHRGWDLHPLLALAFAGSLVFVSKGATVDYIFTLGEPLLCVFGAVALAMAVVQLIGSNQPQASGLRPVRRAARRWALVTLALLVLGQATRNAFFYAEVLGGSQWEMQAEDVRQVIRVIEQHTRPGDAMLTPPFYAFISGRRVAGEYAEIFLWNIKYWNERLLPEFQGLPPGEGIRKVEELATLLHRGEIPLVILDLNQTGQIPEIREALEAAYEPWGEPFRSMNTPMRFHVPRRGAMDGASF